MTTKYFDYRVWPQNLKEGDLLFVKQTGSLYIVTENDTQNERLTIYGYSTLFNRWNSGLTIRYEEYPPLNYVACIGNVLASNQEMEYFLCERELQFDGR